MLLPNYSLYLMTEEVVELAVPASPLDPRGLVGRTVVLKQLSPGDCESAEFKAAALEKKIFYTLNNDTLYAHEETMAGLKKKEIVNIKLLHEDGTASDVSTEEVAATSDQFYLQAVDAVAQYQIENKKRREAQEPSVLDAVLTAVKAEAFVIATATLQAVAAITLNEIKNRIVSAYSEHLIQEAARGRQSANHKRMLQEIYHQFTLFAQRKAISIIKESV